MTSSISGNYGSVGMMQHHRPDPAKMASKLFSQLDSKNQGYIEKSDLESAFSKIANNSSSGDSTTSADAVFSQLDSDGDGKVTQDEMTSGIKKLADQLHSQFDQMRMNGFGGQGAQGMGGMPPPPPPGGTDGQNRQDSGFTKDELQSQLQDIGSSDSQRASLISKIIDNFSQADGDGDGKVNFKEARAFDQSQDSSSTASAASTPGTTTSMNEADSSEAKLMHKIMQLMHAYGSQDNGLASGLLSTSA